jgi:hypothetical protein
MNRILVLGDLHAGSTVSPWPVGVPLPDGGLYEPSKAQRYLLGCWRDMLAEVEQMGRPTLVLLGDLIQGSHAKDGQLVSPLLSVQVEGARRLLMPLVERCERVYCLRGTQWHEGRLSEHVAGLARELDAVPHPKTGEAMWWELHLDTGGGKVIHFAHHITATMLPATEANALLRDLLNTIVELQRAHGRLAPDLKMIVRAHRHRAAYVQVPPGLHALSVPPWQLRTSYAYGKAIASLPQVGYAVIEAGGEISARVRTFPLPRAHVERLG